MLVIYADGVFYFVSEETGYRPTPNSFTYKAQNVKGVAFNPKGSSIAYYGGGQQCHLWLLELALESAVVVREEDGMSLTFREGLRSVDYSQDGQWLACNSTNEIHIINTHTLTCLHTIMMPKLPRYVGINSCNSGNYSVFAQAECYKVFFEPDSRHLHLLVSFSFNNHYDFVQSARAEGVSPSAMVTEKEQLLLALRSSASVHSYCYKESPITMDIISTGNDQSTYHPSMWVPDHHSLEMEPHPLWVDSPINNWTMSYNCRMMANLNSLSGEVIILGLERNSDF
jgi:hypothetical protein